jgi:very-short-patch-repair endonuclease
LRGEGAIATELRLSGRGVLMERRKIIPYNPRLKEPAKKLRKQGILSEVLLWNELKGKKLQFDFHRQKPIQEYIVDFFCSELSLVIEIDGCSHNDKFDDDQKRQKTLEDLGLTVLRYYDGDVKQNLRSVVDHIKEWISEHTPSPPVAAPPLSRGEL